ncbi:hypothetical protein BWI92_12800 [Flectobacillus sp. BAB-3569]|nr:hypothetical protein BWI92_12800 [Flectobacillus sp. BAB-3569]
MLNNEGYSVQSYNSVGRFNIKFIEGSQKSQPQRSWLLMITILNAKDIVTNGISLRDFERVLIKVTI